MSRTEDWLIAVAGGCLIVLGVVWLPRDGGLTLLGVLIGGAISAAFSWYYYQRASNDLKDEAKELREESEKLRRHTTLILRGLEESGKAGKVEYNRNDQGDIIGIAFKRTASSAVNVTDSAGASINPDAPRQDEEGEDAPADQR